MKFLMEAKAKWTDGMRKVAQLYPAAVGSKNWPEIISLANSGRLDAAKALAAKGEMHPHIKAHNILARRMRIERTELFARLIRAEKALRGMLDVYSERIAGAVEDKGHDFKNVKRISQLIDDETTALRGSMRVWFGAAVRDATKMGFRHAGNAVAGILKHNQEAIKREIIADRVLFEARLVFGVTASLSGRAAPFISKAKASAYTQRIIKKAAKATLSGLKPSASIWDLTTRAKQDLKRIVASNMVQGENPAVTARKIRQYISPRIVNAQELGVGELGPGVYRSPYRNAMRLTRTEMNRTYTQAQQAFVKDKPWLLGSRITLSPLHSDVDDCDDQAGRVVQADDTDVPPFHPHCMCSLVPAIDPKYLGEEEAA